AVLRAGGAAAAARVGAVAPVGRVRRERGPLVARAQREDMPATAGVGQRGGHLTPAHRAPPPARPGLRLAAAPPHRGRRDTTTHRVTPPAGRPTPPVGDRAPLPPPARGRGGVRPHPGP